MVCCRFPGFCVMLSSGNGGVAQLGERLLCKQEVIGSIPFTSTSQQTDISDPISELTAGGAADRRWHLRVIWTRQKNIGRAISLAGCRHSWRREGRRGCVD